MKTLKKILACVLSLVLVLSLAACEPLDAVYGGIFDFIFEDILGWEKTSSQEEDEDPGTGAEREVSEDTADYSVPEFTGYDEEIIKALCEELSGLASGTDFEDITACYEELVTEFDRLYDQEILSYLIYCTDASNEEYYAQYNELYLMLVTYADEAYMAMKEVLSGPCADEFSEYIGSEYTEELNEYEELTDQELEWTEEENDLIAQYNSAYEEFEASESSDYSEFNEAVGPIYLELVTLRTEMAAYYGYDDYASYADAEIYGRDLSSEEAAIFCEAVKEVSSEFYDLLYNSLAYFGLYYYGGSFTADELTGAAYNYSSYISSYVTQTLDIMLEYDLCDIAEDEARINGSFSTTFSNGAPTLFINMNGWADFQTMTHELGHCVNSYLTADRGNMLLSESRCYDILEIHSNGLEALYMEYYDEIYGSVSDYAASFTLMELMVNVIDGAIYDEFQRIVYENPDMTLDEINDLYEELLEEYGNPYAQDDKYYWVCVSHNFESPMYYLSYGLSGLAAIQIWDLSQDDYESAVSVWEYIVSTDAADIGYLEMLEECGLGSFMDEGTAEDVCENALEAAYSYSISAGSGQRGNFGGGFSGWGY